MPPPMSPHRQLGDPLSPRPLRTHVPPRIDVDAKPNVVLGFSPPSSAGLPTLPEGSTPNPLAAAPLQFPPSSTQLSRLSPQLTTPTDQVGFGFNSSSPLQYGTSPRGHHAELPPRSRRNSAAIVSISLSSRSRSRTPRGVHSVLPAGSSGNATPDKGSNTVTPRAEDAAFMPGPIDFDPLGDLQPTGGLLLDDEGSDTHRDEAVIEDDVDDHGRQWTVDGYQEEDVVEDILSPGFEFGEGLEFEGEVIQPAVGRVAGINGSEGLPLRRGGSEAGKPSRGNAPNKVYQVIRRLGSGSYAVVYLVREKGGRRREYALKCLSKHNLEPEQIETQLFEATIHLSLPIHKNIVTLHQTMQTKRWLFLMLELCPGEDLFFWLEKSRDASPPPVNAKLHDESSHPMSSSKFSSSSIPFSSSQMFPNLSSHFSSSFTNSPNTMFSSREASPASLLFAHANHSTSHQGFPPTQTPPTPSLLSAFAANTLLSPRRLRLIASMFSQMCESVAVCHDAGVSHRDIKPENFICCDSVELETTVVVNDDDDALDFGPQAKRKVVVKLTDFGLATAEDESGDVECGSKPYMSYECRNNLGPTYYPAPADVWSLGIVLINMLFHRNPWKDPCPGDPNFDKFLIDPTGFLLAKFTGIGREVATYLAEHVLCVDVNDRVGAREFALWVRNLTEMIAGRKAVKDLKLARLDKTADKSMFVKSPVESKDKVRKGSMSALTSSAPLTQTPTFPALSSLSPPVDAPEEPEPPVPDLGKDPESEDLRSASTLDEHPTPADSSQVPSPDTSDGRDADFEVSPGADVDDARSLSTHKRRKRGVRKGKAAQAALAAQTAGETNDREVLLAEFAAAAQSLARDLSKQPRMAEVSSPIEFPPLGTTPSQVAAAKKSKWKDLVKLSSGNPQLEALARRVAERDAQSGGIWSAPAKLQHDNRLGGASMVRPNLKQTHTQTGTMSSEFSSAISSFGPLSSATSSSGGVDDDNWRLRGIIQEDQEDEIEQQAFLYTEKDPILVEDHRLREGRRHRSTEEDLARAKQAALAAAAITGNMGTMGSFGQRHPPPAAPAYSVRSSIPIISRPTIPSRQTQPHRLHSIVDEDPSETDLSAASAVKRPTNMSSSKSAPVIYETVSAYDPTLDNVMEISSQTTRPSMPTDHGSESTLSSIAPSISTVQSGAAGPNKPKLKGQIQSLAKMLSGLKTKGKE